MPGVRRSVGVAKRKTIGPVQLYGYDFTGTTGTPWVGWTQVGFGGFDLQSGRGRLATLASANTRVAAYLNTALSQDFEARYDIFPVTMTGAESYHATHFRAQSTSFLSNFWQFTSWQIRLTVGGGGFLGLNRLDGSGNETSLAHVSVPFVVGDTVHMRVRIVGTNIKARAWVNSASEPGTWTYDITDGSAPTGTIMSHAISNAAVAASDRWDHDTLTVTSISSAPGGSLARTFANTTSSASGTASGGGGGGTTVFPEDFGAVADGRDNHNALQAALNSLNATKTLSIRDGFVYNHSNVLLWTTAGSIIGPGRIHATNETASAFAVLGTDQYLGNVEFSSVNTGRGQTAEEMKVILGGYNGRTCIRGHLVGTRVSSSRCVGFFLANAVDCVLDDCILTSTRADGFHCTFGTHGTRMNRCQSLNPGDDGFAVVSYNTLGDEPICFDIIYTDCIVRNAFFARGFSVVGGTDIHYVNVDVDGARAAGVYLASEGEGSGYDTHAVSNTSVTVKSLANCNTDAAVHHGDILLVAYPGHSVSATVSGHNGNGLITSSDTAASWHIGGIGNATGLVSNLRISPNDGKSLLINQSGASVSISNVAYA